MVIIQKLAVNVKLVAEQMEVEVCLYIKVVVAGDDQGKPQIYPILPNNAPLLSGEPSIYSLPPRKPITIDDPLYQAHILLNLPINLTSTHELPNRVLIPSIDVDVQRGSMNLVVPPSQQSTSSSNLHSARKPPVKADNKGRRSLGGAISSPRGSESSKDKLEYIICLKYLVRVKGDTECDDGVMAMIPIPRCLQNRLILDLEPSSYSDNSFSAAAAAVVDLQIMTSPKVTWLSESQSQRCLKRLDRGFGKMDGTFPSTSMLELRWKDIHLSSLRALSAPSDLDAPISSSTDLTNDFVKINRCHTDATLVFQPMTTPGDASSLIMESMSKLDTRSVSKQMLLMEMNVPDGFEFQALHVKQCVIDLESGLEINHDVTVETVLESHMITTPNNNNNNRHASTSPTSPPRNMKRLSNGRRSVTMTGSQASLLRLQLPPMQSEDCSFEASILMESPNDLDMGVGMEEKEVEEVLGIDVDPVFTPTKANREYSTMILSASHTKSGTPHGDHSPGGMQFILNLPQKTDATPIILIMQIVFSKINEPSSNSFSPHTAKIPTYNFPNTPIHDFELVIANPTPSAIGYDRWKIELEQSSLEQARLASSEVCRITMTSTIDAEVPLFTLHQWPEMTDESTPAGRCRTEAKVLHHGLPDTPETPETPTSDSEYCVVGGPYRDGKTTPDEDVFGSMSERLHVRRSIPETWSRRRGASGDCDAMQEIRTTQEASSSSAPTLLANLNRISTPDIQSFGLPAHAPVSSQDFKDACPSPQQQYKTWILGFLCGIFAVLSIQSSYQQAERLRSLSGDLNWSRPWKNDQVWQAEAATTTTNMEGVIVTVSTSIAENHSPWTDSSFSLANLDQQDLSFTNHQIPPIASTRSPYSAISTSTAATTYFASTFTDGITTHYALWDELSLGLTHILQALLRYNPFYWVLGKDSHSNDFSDNDPDDERIVDA